MARSTLIKELRKYFSLFKVNCHELQSVEKIRKRKGEFGEMAQELSSRWLGSREHSALPEDRSLVPRAPFGCFTAASNSSSREFNAL